MCCACVRVCVLVCVSPWYVCAIFVRVFMCDCDLRHEAVVSREGFGVWSCRAYFNFPTNSSTFGEKFPTRGRGGRNRGGGGICCH